MFTCSVRHRMKMASCRLPAANSSHLGGELVRGINCRYGNIRTAFISMVIASCLFAPAPPALAIGQPSYVETTWHRGDFSIVRLQVATPLYVDANDYPGVIRAAGDLQQDIIRVTAFAPPVLRGQPAGPLAIIIGTIG